MLIAFAALIVASAARADDIDGALSFLARFLLAILAGLVLAHHSLDGALILGAISRALVEVAAHVVQGPAATAWGSKLGDAGSYHLFLAGTALPIAVIAAARPAVQGWLGAAAGAVLLGLTRSRAALFSLGIGLVTLALYRLRRGQTGPARPSRALLAAAGIASVAVAVLIAVLTWGDAIRTAEPRLAYARVALAATARHPWGGLGWDGFAEEARESGIDPPALDPHNLFLDIAAGAGIPALLSFCGLVWSLRTRTPSFAAVCAAMCYSMFVSIYLDWPVFWLLLFSGGTKDG
ncbi:MAG: O-antigen ligase family protein [Acidobacteriota bacterium]